MEETNEWSMQQEERRQNQIVKGQKLQNRGRSNWQRRGGPNKPNQNNNVQYHRKNGRQNNEQTQHQAGGKGQPGKKHWFNGKRGRGGQRKDSNKRNFGNM